MRLFFIFEKLRNVAYGLLNTLTNIRPSLFEKGHFVTHELLCYVNFE